MNIIWHATASLIIFFLSCRFYSKFIEGRIFRLNPCLNIRLISLLSITIWIKRQTKPVIFTSISAGFLLTMATWAMLKQLIFEWSGLVQQGASLLLFFSRVIILGVVIWMLMELLSLLLNAKKIIISKALDDYN